MSVEYASRIPNFKLDVETYGKIGERFFKSTLGKAMESKGWVVHDVSGNQFWQEVDTDFVISKERKPLEDSFDTIRDPSFVKIEVKVDTRCHITGNLPYEIISHGKPGWCVKTHADKAMIIACKDGFENGMLYAYEFYMIDMVKWKLFSQYSSNLFKVNEISGEKIFDFLHKIELMKSASVIESTKEINNWI